MYALGNAITDRSAMIADLYRWGVDENTIYNAVEQDAEYGGGDRLAALHARARSMVPAPSAPAPSAPAPSASRPQQGQTQQGQTQQRQQGGGFDLMDAFSWGLNQLRPQQPVGDNSMLLIGGAAAVGLVALLLIVKMKR